MLSKLFVVTLSAGGLLLAQHGGGGHHGGGGGGGGVHGGGSVGSVGGFRGGGGGYVNRGGGAYANPNGFYSATPQSYGGHLPFSVPMSNGAFGYNSIAPTPTPSHGGHLTFSVPMTNGRTGSGVYGVERPGWGRGTNRRPERGERGRGYVGLGYYPFLGYGYYDDDSFAPSYYSDQQPEPDYVPEYEPAPEPDYYQYPPIPYAMNPDQLAPAPAMNEPEQPSTPVTLILKNGQKLEVRNYAIMNGVFWDFTKQNSKRIPLSEIDEVASAKATDEAGGAFPEESFAISPK